MAKRITSIATFTPTAVADTANLTDAVHMLIQGGSTTQRNRIWEVYMGGQATNSAPTFMILGRDSTVMSSTGNSLATGQTDASLEAATAALAAPALVGNTNASSKPQRSSTLHLLNLSFNAFGGIVRWVAAPEEVVDLVGNTASLGEVSLSAFTGGTPGLMGSHIIYETF